MAASMRRMNGLWRRMAGVLVLCALLLSNEVTCDDDPATDATAPATATAVTDAAASAATPHATDDQVVVATSTVAVGGESTASAGPGNALPSATISNITLDNSPVGDTSTTVATAAARTIKDTPAPDVTHVVRTLVPTVICVGKEDVPESNAVKATLATGDCETTKRIIQANPAHWCHKDYCNLKIFQDGNTALVASDDANLATLSDALKSEHLKEKLGITKTESPSSGSSVFVGILVTGLLAALAITVGYLKCQRRPDTKGVRLAEEAHPVDQENQGNTLVSVAPLNPPPETPEKPSENGESPEADKTEPPPPTNGHSTAKTADTEL